MNTYQITVLPYDRILNADEGENLLHVLQQNSLAPDAPCGGNGKCGKCFHNSGTKKKGGFWYDQFLTLSGDPDRGLLCLW